MNPTGHHATLSNRRWGSGALPRCTRQRSPVAVAVMPGDTNQWNQWHVYAYMHSDLHTWYPFEMVIMCKDIWINRWIDRWIPKCIYILYTFRFEHIYVQYICQALDLYLMLRSFAEVAGFQAFPAFLELNDLGWGTSLRQVVVQVVLLVGSGGWTFNH